MDARERSNREAEQCLRIVASVTELCTTMGAHSAVQGVEKYIQLFADDAEDREDFYERKLGQQARKQTDQMEGGRVRRISEAFCALGKDYFMAGGSIQEGWTSFLVRGAVDLEDVEMED